MENDNRLISIPMNEYKELLIIKGKYEELKSQQTSKVNLPLIREYSGKHLEPEEYKISCSSINLEG